MSNFITNIFQHVIGEVVSRPVLEKLGAKTAEKMEYFLKDVHGELLRDIRLLLQREDRQTMIERLKKAAERQEDDRVAKLLIKIPKEDRKELFEWMCWLEDEQWETVLELLENHPIQQALARVQLVYGEKAKKIWEEYLEPMVAAADEMAGELADSISPLKEGLRNINGSLDSAYERAKTWAERGRRQK